MSDIVTSDNTTRRYISLLEAYMSGNFTKSNSVGKENHLVYPDYIDPLISYDDPIHNANDILKSAFGNTVRSIEAWRPLDIQMKFYQQSNETKVDYLKNLSEHEKAQLQNIRLYDFIRGINMVPPDNARELAEKCTSADEYETLMKSEMYENLNQQAEAIKKNRLAIGTAMRLSDIDLLIEACKSPLYFTGTSIVPLDKHIEMSISSIEKYGLDNLTDNESRATRECCIC